MLLLITVHSERQSGSVRDTKRSSLPWVFPRLPVVRKLVLQGSAVVAVLVLLAAVDRAIGNQDGGGPYRREIPRPIVAVQRAAGARHIVVGQSTSNWFAGALAKAWRLENGAVVDAHMSDCLPTCTLAEARHLQALGRHFETATFGVNTFAYCEEYRERRSMQEVELMPIADSLELARVYIHSDDPLRYVGGWLMNHVSLVYGNTMWLQRHTRQALVGNEAPNGNWFRRDPPKPRRREAFGCDYVAADRDFGLAATRGALVALEALAARVLLVVLPDRAYAVDTPEARAARELFVREHGELVSGFERVELIDLLSPKLTHRELFRDGAHLNAKGIRVAQNELIARAPRLPSAADAGSRRADRDSGGAVDTQPDTAPETERDTDIEDVAGDAIEPRLEPGLEAPSPGGGVLPAAEHE
jgi:hypothetical protein